MSVGNIFSSEVSPTKKFIATFNSIRSDLTAMGLPPGKFRDMAQIGADDLDFFFEPFLVIPRLIDLQEWLIYPSKNVNTWLAKKDAVVNILLQLFIAMTVGDNMKGRVFTDESLKVEDEELTKIVQDWLTMPCGSSGNNRGKTIANWVLPKIIKDNFITGGCAFLKFIGFRPVSPPEEVGKLMLRWLEPRTYIKVHHDIYGYSKLIQFPMVQHDLPQDEEKFKDWMPAVRNRFQNLSSFGQGVELSPVHIDSDQYYYFNLFHEAPINTALQPILSKLTLLFLRDKFIEKATYPFFIVKVPRNATLDPDDESFKAKLEEVAELIASFRAGDVIAIEGEMYDIDNTNQKIILSDGWEVILIEVKSGTINFEDAIRELNEEIAFSMMSSMAAISAIGVQGRTTTLSTGGYINANLALMVKNSRESIKSVFKYILQDVIYQETGMKIDLRLIDIAFSKIREEDAAQFLNQIISFHGAGAMTTNELREEGERIGLSLKPFPPEMTPEGQMALGLEELLNEGIFSIPPSWLKIRGEMTTLEKTRDDMQNAAGGQDDKQD